MATSSTFTKLQQCFSNSNSTCSMLQKYSRAFNQHSFRLTSKSSSIVYIRKDFATYHPDPGPDNLDNQNQGNIPNKAKDDVERDPFTVFSESKVQTLLYNMTGFDIMKVAGPKIVPLTKPVYKLLTSEELAQEQKSANERLQLKLQMPPFMNPRKPPTAPLAVDPDLAHHDTSTFVFADVSFGLKDRERTVTVRDVDGTLRSAPWDVKERLNQIYNPREGRKVIVPSMFKEDNLERMIKEKKYLYILDRACCQFEPDDPDYIRTTRRIYRALDSNADYQLLWSTRHFGPMAFYLVWHHMIDGLLAHMLDSDKLQDAKDLVYLTTIVHPDSPCVAAISHLPDGHDDLDIIKAYISTQSKQKDKLELSVQALEDSERSQSKKSSLT